MKLTIRGREHEFPKVDTWTFRERKLVKDLTGLRAGEMFEAFTKGDTDAQVAVAAIALFRAGEATTVPELAWLYDLTDEDVDIDVTDDDEPDGEAGADADPPAEASESSPSESTDSTTRPENGTPS